MADAVSEVTRDVAGARLRPYVAGLAVEWLGTSPQRRHRRLEGSLAFVDISGFTTLTERLATRGKAGAEEMSDLLDSAFARLLEEAYVYGAALVKWGGDAVLLLFEGPEHARLAARAAAEMQRTMRRIGRLHTSVGVVQLRMSVGVHSGSFDFFLGGRRHRELVVAGRAATTTAAMEQLAEAGEVVVSAATAALLPARCLGTTRGEGRLLRAAPEVFRRSRVWAGGGHGDLGSCLDPAIRDHLLTEVGDSEHRQVAVGFVEVSGVDDLLLRQGPGATAEAVHQLLVRVQDQCHHHRVTFWETDISRNGFKVLLVAGAPRSSGHDEEGLLRAARGVLDLHDGALSLRIGVHCGRVFSGGFGPAFRRTWSVKGDAVNLAARVMGQAAPGQLLATQALLSRVPVATSTVPLAPFLVKGKQQPVIAAVVSAVGQTRGFDAAESGPLLGREDELANLQRKLVTASEGRGVVVLVTGEPGVGKSRLVAQLRGGTGPVRMLRCHAEEYESATPQFVLNQVLRAALEVQEDASNDALVVAVEQLLGASRPDLLARVPLLASALGVQRDETPETAAVTGHFRRARLASLAVVVLGLALEGPTLLVVEDAHHVDEASAEVLGVLAGSAGDHPWLVVLVGRSAPEGWDPDAPAERLLLAPLDAVAGKALVLASGGEGLSPHVLRELVARAEGNPLFLVELTAAATSGADDLPLTLEELLVSRIDDLAPVERQVMRVASVLGTRFEDDLLERLLGGPVAEGTWRRLDRFVAIEAAGSRRFRSGLVRDAAYEGLPFRRRVELHGRAADLLLHHVRQDEAELAGPLSLHALAAQRHADAWRWSVLAGRHAQQVHANANALTFLARARAAARRLPDLDAGEHAAVIESVGDLHARLAELEPAVLAYREARRRAPSQDRVMRARIALSTALVTQRAGQVARAQRWLSMAQRDCERGPGAVDDADLAQLAARVTVERAFAQHLVGREGRAARLCQDALSQAEESGASEVVGRALLLLEWIDLVAGDAGDETRALRALSVFEQCNDLPRQGGAWNHLGMSAYFRGNWDAAVDRYRQAQEVHERCADDWNAAIASANIAEILIDQGRLEEAEPLVVEALRIWRASGTPSDVGFGAALLGRLCARRARYGEALALLSEASACFAVNHERAELVDVELRVAEALLLQGAAPAAAARLAEAEHRLRDAARAGGLPTDDDGLPRTPHGVALLRLRGCVAVQQEEQELAGALLARSIALARTLASTHEVALSLRALAWAQGTSSDEADALLAGLGVVWSPELPRSAGQILIPAQSSPV